MHGKQEGLFLAKEKKIKIALPEEEINSSSKKEPRSAGTQEKNSPEKDTKITQLQKELKAREEQIEHLKNDYQNQKGKNQEISDKYLRLQAEFENFRKRMEREKADFLKYSMENFFKELLPVIDNFELALESAKKASDLEGFSEGVKLIHKQLQDILQKEGLAHFSSVGEPFDPMKHQAVMQVESDTHSENTIVEELKKGYLLKERLLRPALVSVAKKKSNAQK